MSTSIGTFNFLYNDMKTMGTRQFFIDDDIPFANATTAQGYVNGNKGRIYLYTTALLNYSPSTAESPVNLKLSGTVVTTNLSTGDSQTEAGTMPFNVVTISGKYYHVIELGSIWYGQDFVPATGLMFQSNTEAEGYLSGTVSPLDAENALQTEWTCYWQADGAGGYTMKLVWYSANIEKYGNVNEAKVLLGTAGRANIAFQALNPDTILENEGTSAYQYTSSSLNVLSTTVINIFEARLDKTSMFQKWAIFDLYLTLQLLYNNKYSEMVAIHFIGNDVSVYKLDTSGYKLSNEYYVNNTADGSIIYFRNSTGATDDGYNDRHDETEGSELNGTYNRGNSFITTYAITNDKLNALGDSLWTQDFIKNILLINNNPIDNVISIFKYPASIADGGDNNIYIGNIDMNVKGDTALNDGIIEVGEFTVSGIYNNFLDFEPYSKLLLYLPFRGFVELNVSNMLNRTFKLKYILDYLTGQSHAVLFTEEYVFQSWECQIGIEIPVSYSGNKSSQLSAIGDVIDMIEAGAQANVIGAINAGISAFTEPVHPIQKGGVSADCFARECTSAYLLRIYPQWQEPAGYAHQYGKPCNLTRTINTLSGFTQVAPDFDTSDLLDMSLNELEELKSIMSEGFYV